MCAWGLWSSGDFAAGGMSSVGGLPLCVPLGTWLCPDRIPGLCQGRVYLLSDALPKPSRLRCRKQEILEDSLPVSAAPLESA